MMLKKIAYGCGIIVLLVVIAGGFILWRLSAPPQRIESSLAATPQERAKQKAAIQQLRQDVESIHQQKGESAPFELHISEAQLNALLAQGAEKGSKYHIENLASRLEPDLLTLQGTAQYHGVPVTLTLTGNLKVEGSQLVFNAQSLWLGGFSAPGEWRDKISHFVSKQLNGAVAKNVGRLDAVEIQLDAIIIRGKTQ